MKHLCIILMSFLLTSCFVFDKIPEVKVKLDKSIIADVDSIFLVDNSPYADSKMENSKRVAPEITDYSFFTYRSNARIKIKLRDSKEFWSDSSILQSSTSKIKISRINNSVRFDKIIVTNFEKYAPLVLIILLIVLITKVPIAILIIWPQNKTKLFLNYSGLNLIYIAIFVIVMILNFDSFPILLYPFYLLILVADLIFLVKYYDDRSVWRPIVAGIVSNLIYLTIGQFIITFAIMSNS